MNPVSASPPLGDEKVALDAEDLVFLYYARATTATLEAAETLGVLDRLRRGPLDAAVLASAAHLGEREATALLGALAGLGLATVDGGGAYRARPDLDAVMALLRTWDGLPQALRHGPRVPSDSRAGAEETYSQVVSQLGVAFRSAAVRAAQHLKGTRVLDLGAGAAPWSLALVASDPTCQVTAVDLPAVLPVTREAAAKAGFQDRYTYIEGDLFSVDLAEEVFDMVIVGNLCHLFDEEANRHLLGLVAKWLVPGGTLAIFEPLPHDQDGTERSLALYALGLIARTRRGRVYSFATYAQWLTEVGYQEIERFDLAQQPSLALVRAKRS